VLQLSGAADVIVENYRPGVLERLGIGFERVSALNNEIIYCSISGFGQTGVYKSRGAFDVVVQAMSGLMWITGDEEGAPAKCGVPVADFVAGLYAAFSILAARDIVNLEHRPIYLDCAMLDCVLGISALQTSEYWGTGISPSFVIAAGNDHLWAEVAAAVDRSDLLGDSRFSTISDRAANQKALAAVLQPIFKQRSVRDWLLEFERRGVPCSQVNNHEQILNDEELVKSGLLQELPLPFEGTTKTISFPVRVNGTRAGVRRRPPLLGEHTEEVIAEWSRPRKHHGA
jgi:crotonobetainyl-CoA:carnitine CoA-transferase CaiB-like acyl-CoA transferase